MVQEYHDARSDELTVERKYSFRDPDVNLAARNLKIPHHRIMQHRTMDHFSNLVASAADCEVVKGTERSSTQERLCTLNAEGMTAVAASGSGLGHRARRLDSPSSTSSCCFRCIHARQRLRHWQKPVKAGEQAHSLPSWGIMGMSTCDGRD